MQTHSYSWTNDPQELPSAGEMEDYDDNCPTCGYPEGYGCSDCDPEPTLPKDW